MCTRAPATHSREHSLMLLSVNIGDGASRAQHVNDLQLATLGVDATASFR